MEHALDTVMQTIWSAMFPGLALERGDGELSGQELRATVAYSGGWSGELVLRCGEPLGQRLASELFGRAPDQVTPGDVDDVLSELVNVAAGNLGCTLPGRPQISLPTIARGEAQPDSAPVREAVALRVDGELLRVDLRGA